MEVLISTLQKIATVIKDWGALIIAGISLLVAIISLYKSSKAQCLQNKVNELELKIKQNELDRIATSYYYNIFRFIVRFWDICVSVCHLTVFPLLVSFSSITFSTAFTMFS